ncbi:hypothetical protein D3C85_344790 [compost metagenome]
MNLDEESLKGVVALMDYISELQSIVNEQNREIIHLKSLNKTEEKHAAERAFIGLYRKLEEKVEVYENLLHSIQASRVAFNSERVRLLLSLIDNWSYAHRQGNGEKSEKEIQEAVHAAFNKIKETVGG